MSVTVGDLAELLSDRYRPDWAESWDRVGLVCGRHRSPARRVLCVVDCVPETVAQARRLGADLIVAHHPLLLRGVSSLDPATYKGDLVHTLIENGIALYVAHTNADVAAPGVSDALAHRLGLDELRPLRPLPGAAHAGSGRGIGRIGRLAEPMNLAEFTEFVAEMLPPTAWGVRAAGDPDRTVRDVAVSGGAGDTYLADAVTAAVDVYLTADLRHHPASEHLAGCGPALVDVAHWASERPWLDLLAADFPETVDVVVSNLNTDPWTLHQGAHS